MSSGLPLAESLFEGRYDRQARLEWWDQRRVREARILVVGAGALGNEVLKNFALLGVGTLLVVDMDLIETSNLARAVLFRAGDEGEAKCAVAARRAAELGPDTRIVPIRANALLGLGLGAFAWADVIVGAVDNREARVFVNAAAARVRKPWVDGAIEGLSGIARGFDPSHGSCYECTMNATDRKLLAERRSCAMLARRVVESGRVPATAVAASIVGAIQAQEAVKILHGQQALRGEGLHFDGLWNEWSRVSYPRQDDCPGHDSLDRLEPIPSGIADTTIAELLRRGESELGGPVTLDFSRDVVLALECPACARSESCGRVLGAVTEEQARCPSCGEHRLVQSASSTQAAGPVDPRLTLAELGLPAWDVVVARRGSGSHVGWILQGDERGVLGAAGGA